MTSANNRFGKEKHLKSRKQIDQLFTGGKAFFVHPVKVFWRLEEIQLTDDRGQMTGEIQMTDDRQPTTDAIQFADKEIGALQKTGGENQPSPIGNPSSVVRRPSLVSVGVSASKRNFKKAVDRNRVKRLLRECYRLNQQPLEEAMGGKNVTLQVFFIFVDKTIPTFASLQEKMVICLKRLQKIAGEAKNEKLL
jgi:ribonuclease P protein component